MKQNDTPKTVAALRYDKMRDHMPKGVAKGRGKVADRILTLAKENNVPMVQDRNLVQMLDVLDLNTEIPTALYQAVAGVLVFVYQINQQR